MVAPDEFIRVMDTLPPLPVPRPLARIVNGNVLEVLQSMELAVIATLPPLPLLIIAGVTESPSGMPLPLAVNSTFELGAKSVTEPPLPPNGPPAAKKSI